MLNQLPLWCRQCGATYDSFDDEGRCSECDTHNVLERHTFNVIIPISAYTKEEAKQLLTEIVEHLVRREHLPEGTVIQP